MTGAAQSRLLPDGRLHLHHGPIDLIIDAEGRSVPPPSTRRAMPSSAYWAGWSKNSKSCGLRQAREANAVDPWRGG